VPSKSIFLPEKISSHVVQLVESFREQISELFSFLSELPFGNKRTLFVILLSSFTAIICFSATAGIS
ncbi:MAG: hypothetical protein ACP5SE_04590, partial [Nitrososphaeria archaeon]